MASHSVAPPLTLTAQARLVEDKLRATEGWYASVLDSSVPADTRRTVAEALASARALVSRIQADEIRDVAAAPRTTTSWGELLPDGTQSGPDWWVSPWDVTAPLTIPDPNPGPPQCWREWGEYVCTRENSHSGPHMAGVGGQEITAEWDIPS